MKRLAISVTLALLMLAGLLAGFGFLASEPVQAYQFEVTVPEVTGTLVVQPNQLYVITASGYAPADALDITFNGSRLFNGAADGDGQLTNTAKIPVLPFGDYVVQSRNQNSLVATYTASISPFLLTNSDQGSPGGPLRLEGVGFAMGERVTLTFRSMITCTAEEGMEDDAGTKIELGILTATNQGTFRLNTTVPITGAGTYYVGALGATSNYCTVAN